ncbi:response regulator [Sulfurimonas sp. SAG-AH-194-C21]|nr:response regulator [Sulfurimonas sp. SAG-AH-194-C21]MDF1882915.1 response regulator [Sulfurimonas sp. SAG-AH-194-C21]
MKIIILDDSVTIQMIIESYLEDLGVKEDEMFLFSNGVEALDFIKKQGASIIFSDINMPIMEGYEFATKVFEIRPDLKNSFFAVSGDENRESYLKMKASGAHRFLKKPINAKHFNHFVSLEISKCRAMEFTTDF